MLKSQIEIYTTEVNRRLATVVDDASPLTEVAFWKRSRLNMQKLDNIPKRSKEQNGLKIMPLVLG
jgi:hypothetical protein